MNLCFGHNTLIGWCLLKQLGTRVENLLKKSLHTYQTINNEDQLPYVSDDSSGSDDDSSYFET